MQSEAHRQCVHLYCVEIDTLAGQPAAACTAHAHTQRTRNCTASAALSEQVGKRLEQPQQKAAACMPASQKHAFPPAAAVAQEGRGRPLQDGRPEDPWRLWQGQAASWMCSRPSRHRCRGWPHQMSRLWRIWMSRTWPFTLQVHISPFMRRRALIGCCGGSVST